MKRMSERNESSSKKRQNFQNKGQEFMLETLLWWTEEAALPKVEGPIVSVFQQYAKTYDEYVSQSI